MQVNLARNYDFSNVYQSIQSYIDKNILSGASAVILKDNDIVDSAMLGFADIENKKKIQEDTIFRIYSNTKIITSVAAMCCYEDGCFELDDPLSAHLPQLGHLSAIKPGAGSVTDVEPVRNEPTVRQLMCHNAGLSYGFLLESPVDELYNDSNMMDPQSTLAEMIDKLAEMPLASQPGSRWQYSVSTDVLARLVEIWSGQSFIDFLKKRIFTPLGMRDTDFYVPEDKHSRLAVNYVPVDPLEPMKGGLNPAADQLLGSYLQPKAFLSGGGGLVSTIGDYTRFIRMLICEGEFNSTRILKPETVRVMHSNQLPENMLVTLPNWVMPNTVFGLGLAIKTAPSAGEPVLAIDEFHWGGMAGTHSFISPRAGIAALIFTQRLPGFWHPFSHDFKRLVYQAMCP